MYVAIGFLIVIVVTAILVVRHMAKQAKKISDEIYQDYKSDDQTRDDQDE